MRVRPILIGFDVYSRYLRQPTAALQKTSITNIRFARDRQDPGTYPIGWPACTPDDLGLQLTTRSSIDSLRCDILFYLIIIFLTLQHRLKSMPRSDPVTSGSEINSFLCVSYNINVNNNSLEIAALVPQNMENFSKRVENCNFQFRNLLFRIGYIVHEFEIIVERFT